MTAQKGKDLLLFHRREIFEEFVDGVTAFEAIKKVPDRNTSSRKNGSGTENFGVPADDTAFHEKDITTNPKIPRVRIFSGLFDIEIPSGELPFAFHSQRFSNTPPLNNSPARRMAAIMLSGRARPFPAISNAVP